MDSLSSSVANPPSWSTPPFTAIGSSNFSSKKKLPIPLCLAPIIQLGEKARKASYAIIAQLGNEGFSAVCNPSKDSLKTQLKMVEKLGVRFTVIIGQREALDGTAILKDLHEGTQETLDQQEIAQRIRRRFASELKDSIV